jgi:NAD(P)-dependent dehydrogenase (short-subunit alcohol dehydrogenase family)
MRDGHPLSGRVAVVAGATRGAGRAIAVELARAGAFVYATGRSSETHGPSEIGRPETIEQTAALMHAAGGVGEAIRVDHSEPEDVTSLVRVIRARHGRLDVLVNDMFGGDRYAQWDVPLWEHDVAGGLRMLRMGIDTHLVTSAIALPLLIDTGNALLVEVTDGTSAVNATRRPGVGFYYDLVKATVDRILIGLADELADSTVVPVGVTPGWLRSEQMLEVFGVTETNWRDACAAEPGFAISESPTYIARGVAALAADPQPQRYVGRVLTARQLADTYDITDTDGSRPDCWGLIDAHGFDHGAPDDLTKYR